MTPPTCVATRRGDVADAPAALEELRTEVHVLEPCGEKNAGSKPPTASKSARAHEEGGGGRLLDVERLVARTVEVAVAAEPGVAREEAVHEERLARGSSRARGRRRSWNRACPSPARRGAAAATAGSASSAAEERRERRLAVPKRGVGVQEEDRLRRAAPSFAARLHAGPKPRFRSRLDHARARALARRPRIRRDDALSTTTTGTPGGTDFTAAARCAAEFHDTIATRTRGTLKRDR